jgi:hypothetical protein
MSARTQIIEMQPRSTEKMIEWGRKTLRPYIERNGGGTRKIYQDKTDISDLTDEAIEDFGRKVDGILVSWMLLEMDTMPRKERIHAFFNMR